jgi:threonine aldolase
MSRRATRPPPRINLYSDTQTRPTPAMRAAIAAAECGDEQHFDDPTVARLCERMADLLGKEDAVFLPSGTMCNEIAILVHVRPGEEIIAHETAHIVCSEGGGPAALAGAMIRTLSGPRGKFTAAQAEAAIRYHPSRYEPRSVLIEVEQTANLGGGTVWPLAEVQAVAAVAKARGLKLHMDGARLMNAVVAAGVPARDFAEGFDSVWLDFTKGLGAPLGAVLAGSSEFIEEAWRWKQRLGGSMRQAGLMAAGCLHALDHHVDRLADDHANAKSLARDLAQVPGVAHVVPPETNLVFATLDRPAQTVAEAAAAQGLWVSVMGANLLRLCTHLDVTEAQCAEAVGILRGILAPA